LRARIIEVPALNGVGTVVLLLSVVVLAKDGLVLRGVEVVLLTKDATLLTLFAVRVEDFEVTLAARLGNDEEVILATRLGSDVLATRLGSDDEVILLALLEIFDVFAGLEVVLLIDDLVWVFDEGRDCDMLLLLDWGGVQPPVIEGTAFTPVMIATTFVPQLAACAM
jgi:hypothetical protein